MFRILSLLSLVAPVIAQGGPPATRVAIDRVTVQEIAEGRTFVGTITAERTSIVGSETDGLVVEMLVEEGDRVEKDQPIAKLRTRLAELRLSGAKALLKVREALLLERKNGSRPEEIAQAKARVEQADDLLVDSHAQMGAQVDQKIVIKIDSADKQTHTHYTTLPGAEEKKMMEFIYNRKK